MDEQPLNWFRSKIFLLLLLAMFADGYDISCVSYAAPPIIAAWHLDQASFGGVFSAGTAGLIIGSAIAGVLGDAVGRRLTILLSMLVTTVATLSTPFASDVQGLMFWRFLTGVGVGALSPACLVMANEFAPRRRQTVFSMLLLVGSAIGGLGAGGIISVLVVPTHGWQSLFYFGGFLSLAVLLMLAIVLPESLKFLFVKHPRSVEIARIARKLQPSLAIGKQTKFVWDEELRSVGKVPYRTLFTDGRLPVTLLLWFTFFCVQAIGYALSSWLPTLLTAQQVSPEGIATAMLLFAASGLVGGFIIARLIDRLGVIAHAAMPLVGIPLVIFVGSLASGSPLLVAAVAISGFSITGSLYGMSAIAGALYPTAIRSNGVGLAFFVSRFGSMLGPLLLGWILGRGATIQSIFIGCAVPLLLAGAGMWMLGRLTQPHSATSAS